MCVKRGLVSLFFVGVFSYFPLRADFDPAFINTAVNNVSDLSIIESGNLVVPGIYDVDVYINDEFAELKKVQFQEKIDNSKKVVPFFSAADLEFYGLKHEVYKEIKPLKNGLLDVSDIKGISLNFDMTRLRLDISIPHTMMNIKPRGYIPESRWDDGVNAALLNYNINYYNNKNQKENNNNFFLNLNTGINIGPWRYREHTNARYDESGESEWSTVSRYIERPLRSLYSSLTIGDKNTSGEMFESVATRSVTLESDQSMLPDSMQGFAPVIRGVANTNAIVTVYQNGYAIYETNVAPGPFELSDISPVSNSGEFTVKIKESDGRYSQFIVPYSAVPVFVRQGQLKYSLVGGEVKAKDSDYPMLQGTVTYGLFSRSTVYSGFQASSDYRAFLVGTGVDFGNLGAFSVDMTTALSDIEFGEQNKGQSYRFLYAKSIPETGTNFQLAGYRYSTSGYRSLNEHLSEVDANEGYYNYPLFENGTRKESYQLNLSQQLNNTNSIFLSANKNTFWNKKTADTLIQVGHSATFNSISLSTFVGYSKNGIDDADKSISVNISVPLAVFGSNTGSVSYTVNNRDGKTSHTAGFGSTLGKNNQFQYNAYDSYSTDINEHYLTTSGVYTGSKGILGASYSQDSNTRQFGANLHGGALLHSGGFTLSQPLGETNILVEAKDAEDLAIASWAGVHTDSNGYAVVPSAMNYRENRISLDATSWNKNVELNETVRKVVPSKGAIVKTSFPVSVGYKAIITLKNNGEYLPFGTLIRMSEKSQTGIVDEHGQVFLSGLDTSGSLVASWGKNTGCIASYSIPKKEVAAGIYYLEAECK